MCRRSNVQEEFTAHQCDRIGTRGAGPCRLRSRRARVGIPKVENPDVTQVFDGYPELMRRKTKRLRQLILDTASETEGVIALEDTLKSGEPSYLTLGGSTFRIG